MEYNLKLCTYATTGADAYVQAKHPVAQRVPVETELETFEALNDGRCDLTVAYYQNWLGFKKQRAYNPDCDLQYVGRPIHTINSGFAVNADSGFLCTSFIGDVLNVYFEELIMSGYIEEMWNSEYEKKKDNNCDVELPPDANEGGEGDARRQRTLRQQQQPPTTQGKRPMTKSQQYQQQKARQQRKLKAGGRGGAAAVGGTVLEEQTSEGERLTLNQMVGTFILHYGLSVLAIMIGYGSRYYTRWSRSKEKAAAEAQMEEHKEDDNQQHSPMTETNGDRKKLSSTEEEEVYDSVAMMAVPTNHGPGVPEEALRQTQQELKEMKEQMELQLNLILSKLNDLQTQRT